MRFCYLAPLINQHLSNMKTLRKFLEADRDYIFSECVKRMAEKLEIDVKILIPESPRYGRDRQIEYLNKIKSEMIVTQFQIQFGLDEEF